MIAHLNCLLILLTVALGIPIFSSHLSSLYLYNTSHPQSSSTNLTVLPSNWHCYEEPSRLNPPDLRHCTRVLAGIRNLHLPQRPLLFSRSEAADFILPVKFSYRTCTVLVDIEGGDEEAEDYLTRLYLIRQIEALEDRCVVRPPFLGGEGKLGWRGKLRMGLFWLIDPEVRVE